jgi:hypothetical protein
VRRRKPPNWLREPPSWVLLLVVAILASHVLSLVIRFIQGFTGSQSLIVAAELIIILVLVVIAMHEYFMPQREGEESAQVWYNHPFSILVLCVSFAIASMFIYAGSAPV